MKRLGMCGSGYQGEHLRVKVGGRTSVLKQKRSVSQVLFMDDTFVVVWKGEMDECVSDKGSDG